MAKKDNKNENKAKKHFFKDFKAELKKVIWPTPKQLVNNTVAVVVIVLITAAIVFVLDAVFDLGNKYGITQLQSIVNEKFNSEEETENTENGQEDTSAEETDTTEENTTTENMQMLLFLKQNKLCTYEHLEKLVFVDFFFRGIGEF